MRERDLVAAIRRRFSPDPAGGGLVLGIGDDCAVWRSTPGALTLATTDTLVEGVHFDRGWHPPRLLGRKAAAANLSDIAAMGGRPCWALLSLGLPPDLADDWITAFLDGLGEALAAAGTTLAGGDTVASPGGVTITVCLLGEGREPGIVRRAGARPGDLIWVGDRLGAAGAGLALCQAGLADRHPEWAHLVAAHLDPGHQVALGQALAATGLLTAMMDLSDGLATDLARLAEESGVGAEVEAAAVPLAAGLEAAALAVGRQALDWALAAGDDYRLLFTAAPAAAEALATAAARAGATIFPVGRIVPGQGVMLLEGGGRREISHQGFEHFAAGPGPGVIGVRPATRR
ncbi:MAG: thiamine-phosphate kinase [Thermodesulfobacteriota bacterium]